MPSEYERRLDLCSEAIDQAVKKLKMTWQFATDYQGIEVAVKTKKANGRVIILLDTGHGPRFPKYITITIHGFFTYEATKKLEICQGRLETSTLKFLPNQISPQELEKAIAKAARAVKKACTAKNLQDLVRQNKSAKSSEDKHAQKRT